MSAISSSDSDGDGEDYTLMYRASHFLQKDIDALITRYAARENFWTSSDLEGEMMLEHTEAHLQFTEEFETMLEAFVMAECPGMPTVDAFQLFLGSAKDTLEGRFMPLCMEDEMTPDRIFVESLLAVDEFTHFFNLMVERAAKLTSIKDASSKVNCEYHNSVYTKTEKRK
jgi:hypothetical protein